MATTNTAGGARGAGSERSCWQSARRRRAGLPWLGLLGLATACSSDAPAPAGGAAGDAGVDAAGDALADAAPPPTGDPATRGPYGVGIASIVTEPDAVGRSLPLELWYPATLPEGAAVHEYQLKAGALILATVPSPLGAVKDAPADRRGGPYPVVVFSHGFGGVRQQSFYLTEYLASHGFVVVAPDHVGNTITEQLNSRLAIPAAEVARLRPLDVGLALDTALALSRGEAGGLDGGAPLAALLSGVLDADRVGVAGHSFGGYTTLRIAGATLDATAAEAECAGSGNIDCAGWAELGGAFPLSARDPRFRAALAQAPGIAEMFHAGGNQGYAAVEIPLMLQGGTTDQTMPWVAEAEQPFEELPAGTLLLGLTDAGHFTFSDLCTALGGLASSISQFSDGCSAANLAVPRAHALINTYATAFFQVHLAGDATFAAVLDPTAAQPPEVARFSVK